MRNHEPEPPIKARFLTHRYCEIINVCPCTWTEAQGYFLMWQEVTNTLSCSINHLRIHKMGRQFHRLWGEARRLCPSDGAGQRVDPRSVLWGTFTALEFWFPHLYNEDRDSAYLTGLFRGLSENKEEMSGQLQRGTRKSVVWLPFLIIFPPLPLPLGISDKFFFQVIQQ